MLSELLLFPLLAPTIRLESSLWHTGHFAHRWKTTNENDATQWSNRRRGITQLIQVYQIIRILRGCWIHSGEPLPSTVYFVLARKLGWSRDKECMLAWVCACLFICVWLFVTPWTSACQAPLSVEFSRQEYWRGLPFPSPGDLPDPGIKPTSLTRMLTAKNKTGSKKIPCKFHQV